MTDQVPVRTGDCACPHREGTPPPHPDGDEVYLRAKPSLPLGLAVQGDIAAAMGDGSLLKQLWQVEYIRFGAIGWNRLDVRGKPVVFNAQEILDDFDVGSLVAEKADELYGEKVVAPLFHRLAETLQGGPTDDSISQDPVSIDSPSEPSSPADSADSPPSTP